MTRLELYDRFNMNCVNTEDCSKCKCCNDETGDLVLCALMFGYQQGKADAIDEYKKKIEFEDKWLLACKVFDTNVDIAFKTLISYAEQLKEQNIK